MNQNIVIGALALVILAGGAFFIFNMKATVPADTTQATTTPTTTTPTTPASSATTPTVVTDVPVVPTNSTSFVVGHVVPNGAPTTYWYEYGETTSFGSRTAAQSIGSGFISIPTPGFITGLRLNTSYYYRLVAENKFGNVNGSTYTFSTNSNLPQTGKSPESSTNSATDIVRASVTVNGHVNPRNSQTMYWFEYGTDKDFGNISSLQSAGTGNESLAVSASLTGLQPLTKYYFRINAQNQFGTVNGSTQDFTTKGPAAAAKPSAETLPAATIGTSTVKMSARVTPNGAATTYIFEYSKDASLATVLGTVTSTQVIAADATSVTVSAETKTLATKTKYYYRVVATNQFGITRGDAVTFTTK